MIMDGRTHDVGSVANLKNIRPAISVAVLIKLIKRFSYSNFNL